MNWFSNFSWYWVIVWAVVAYVALSIRILRYDQIAAVFFLGYPWKEIGPGGPHIVPLFISWARFFDTPTVQFEFPPPDRVQKANQDNLAPGMVAPLRTTQAEARSATYWYKDNQEKWNQKSFSAFTKEEQKGLLADPLNNRLTTEPSIIIRWRIRRVAERTTLFDFIQNIGTVEEANRQIEDTAVASMRALLANVTAGNALSSMPFISERIRENIEILIGDKADLNGRMSEAPWGIDLTTVQIKDIDPGKTVNVSLSDAAAALKKREETITLAEGQAKATILASEAAREAEINKGKGERGRLDEVASAMKTEEGRFAAALDVAETTLPVAKPTIISSDILEMVGGLFNSRRPARRKAIQPVSEGDPSSK